MKPEDVTIGIAFIGGILSFISPCVLPLVPAYIGYMGGRITQQAGLQTARERFGILMHGVFFVLGFTLFFVVFGLLTTAAVSSLTWLGVTEGEVRDGITRLGGTVVILFGLHIMGVLNQVFVWLLKQTPDLDRSAYGNVISVAAGMILIGSVYWLFLESWFLTLIVVLVLLLFFHDALKADTPGEFWSRMIQRIQAVLYMDTRRQTPINSQYGYLGSMFMGIVFSAGWTPCIGPIYGAMLTLASSGESFSKAGVMLTAYALGLGIPFLLTALALDRAQNVFRRLQKNMRMIEIISGVFLLLVGGLILSGQLQRLSTFGGGKSSFGDISANLQDCVVGAFRGEIRPANVPDCIADGVKEDFYIAAAKGTVGQTVPGLNLNPPGPGGPSTGLEIGQRAPNFTAETLDGRTVSLTDYYGQIVLLNFWATWCPACREEMPDFQSVYDLLHTDGFVVLAVDAQEDRATVAQFVDWLGLTFPILLDPTGEVNNVLYGSQTQQGYPASLLIDRDGVIVQHFSGAISGSQLLEALENMLNE